MRQRGNDPKWMGQRFGRLTVTGFVHKRNKWYWRCRCDCGNEIVAQGCIVRSGHTLSCGCYQREVASEANITHGMTKSRLYRIYNAVKNRCYNQGQPNYVNYGARGIRMCEEWLNSFENFREWAMSSGYTDDLTIERIDNSKDYGPDNCRWATRAEQSRNTRRNHLFTYEGRTQVLTDWCAELGLNFHTVENRIHQMHMTTGQALGLEA